MSISMSMPTTASATRSSGISATSSSGMSMGTSGMMMSTMMVFSNDNTALNVFSTAFSPTTTGQYVGTWFFCFFLAVIWRALVLLLFKIDQHWATKYAARSNTKIGAGDGVACISPSTVHAWRLSVNLPRALLAFLIQGVAYLLMIIVMILNVGLFFAVIVGYLVGELLFGRVNVHNAAVAGC